jgi:hypothetical protein
VAVQLGQSVASVTMFSEFDDPVGFAIKTAPASQ